MMFLFVRPYSKATATVMQQLYY